MQKATLCHAERVNQPILGARPNPAKHLILLNQPGWQVAEIGDASLAVNQVQGWMIDPFSMTITEGEMLHWLSIMCKVG